jgi:hypothetical protein
VSGLRTVAGGPASTSERHADGVWGSSLHGVLETVPEALGLEAGADKGKR